MRRLSRVAIVALLLPLTSHADLRVQAFDADPGWESVGSRAARNHSRTVTQDFGHSLTSFAEGAAPGEIGGVIARSLTPAMYWAPIAEKTLDGPLRASGKFAVTPAGGGSGVLVGWFNAESRGWRTPNSLAIRLDGNGGKYWVFFEYGTRELGTGGGVTFEGERYQTTRTPPHPADGSVHVWELAYDPLGADGQGEIRLTLDGVPYIAALGPGHREQGAAFDRFGIINQQTSGDEMTLYVDDLVVDGTRHDSSMHADWVGVGNRVTFEDRAVRPYHDFGYSETSHAGGAQGEMGGMVWRIEEENTAQAGYYADNVGRLTLEDPLHAEGSITMTRAAADSAVLIGWFNSRTYIGAPPQNSLGVLLEGPSRVGHYFRPAYANSSGMGRVVGEGPVMRPARTSHTWTLDYDPDASGGLGRIVVTLDGESVSVGLDTGVRDSGAGFDRFGMLSYQRGGHYVEVWLDDLRYTAGPPR
ncbi:hypothetical protein HN371_26485 [Candidatus Poribacteria bacterium]|jgi:hypothetical protein|nr:hypothetical protein [Candidatus Poribacteria bacterium]MBT5536625.1 hypothetical protein [Candidatus Poribacteria bacterium]MBT5713216.1 hypothetical protein [Candidatus Poribacteria bacterium]MBT7098404.1 hypothetical protein [Candidatus Poribacteria bacterium]MBT7808226.1 hypothetical protein [Candidatus Poribacteria bacterium]